MISFFLNRMGVYGNRWYEDNNVPYNTESSYNRVLGKELEVKRYKKHYAVGRIDIQGVPNETFGLEYGVSVMEEESWLKLWYWLSTLILEYLPTKEQLLKMFEESTGHKIQWFYKDKDNYR